MNRVVILLGASLALAVSTLPALPEPLVPDYGNPIYNLNNPNRYRGPAERQRVERHFNRHRHHGGSRWLRRDGN